MRIVLVNSSHIDSSPRDLVVAIIHGIDVTQRKRSLKARKVRENERINLNFVTM